jgi:hypothetical protein
MTQRRSGARVADRPKTCQWRPRNDRLLPDVRGFRCAVPGIARSTHDSGDLIFKSARSTPWWDHGPMVNKLWTAEYRAARSGERLACGQGWKIK